jgi:hypothetical protein
MQISVVIVAFNDSEYVKECVKSVLKSSCKFTIDTIVVSEDRNNRSGYGENANKGIKQGLANGSDYICLLNDDTKVDHNFLEWMIKENVDICGCKIYDWDSRNIQVYSCGMNMLTGQTSHNPNNHSRDLAQYDHIKNPQWVCGCCVLIKKEVFEKIGYFDERYVAYFEDTDFCWRARKAGFKLGLAPNAYVWHKGGVSSTTVFKTMMIARNRIRFMRKHATKWQLAVFFLYYFGFYLWVTLLYHFIYSEDFSNEKAILRGVYDGCSKLE